MAGAEECATLPLQQKRYDTTIPISKSVPYFISQLTIPKMFQRKHVLKQESQDVEFTQSINLVSKFQ